MTDSLLDRQLGGRGQGGGRFGACLLECLLEVDHSLGGRGQRRTSRRVPLELDHSLGGRGHRAGRFVADLLERLLELGDALLSRSSSASPS